MAWNLTGLFRRRFLKPAPRKPIRRRFRPTLRAIASKGRLIIRRSR